MVLKFASSLQIGAGKAIVALWASIRITVCRQTGFEGKERLAEFSKLRHAMPICMASLYCSTGTRALLRCIWCIIGCYLRHRACLERFRSAVTVALCAVSVVQIVTRNVNGAAATHVTLGSALVRLGRNSGVMLEQPCLKVFV